jgi:(2R)-ethylmalonyl-CoA mutase
VDPAVEAAAVHAVRVWREQRDAAPGGRERWAAALARLEADARSGVNLMPASIECARAGVTTGEWGGALRAVFGEYRAPTGVSSSVSSGGAASGTAADELEAVRTAVRRTGEELGGRLRLLVGKPGLDGHSNGAEQVAVRARDVGFEVIYQGIRLTPAQIVAAAVAEDVHCVGLSVLSGSHMELVPQVLAGMREAGLDDVPLVLGGIVPEADARELVAQGVAAVFTPKDFGLTDIMARIVDQIRQARALPPLEAVATSGV